MATIAAVLARLTTHGSKGVSALWEALTTANDVGSSIEVTGAKTLTVQVFGTFGAGGNLQIQGSNDGTNWYPLQNGNGFQLDLTSASIDHVAQAERPKFVRPKVTAGDGTTDLDVLLIQGD